MKRPPDVTDAEWRVMEVLWTRSPLSSAEIIAELLASTGWKANTVRTLLARLVRKGAIKASGDASRYFYQARFSREEYVSEVSESFLERVFRGAAEPLLLHFAGKAQLSRKKIAELRRLLEEEE